MVVAGLVVDGGGALNARMTLADDVEAAAVAGAQATDDLRLRGPEGELVSTPSKPSSAPSRCSRAADTRASSWSRPTTTVRVTAHDTVATKMLLLIGYNQFDIEATATSEAEILP